MNPPRVQLQGLLGDALAANQRGRLFHFITGPSSPAIALFNPERTSHNVEGDWYGEHAGKWLIAAAKSAAQSHSAELAATVRQVADHLVNLQQADGYLGTYAPARRFMVKQAAGPKTWDGAPGQRTWDIWTHSYLILGLLEVHRHFPDERWLQAARRIGDLCWRTLAAGEIDITELGNHHGLSATVLMDPAIELHLATGEQRYLDLALLVLVQADRHPELGLLRKALAGVDAADIASGKAYQLLWNLLALAKLHRLTGRDDLGQAVLQLWQSIRDHHLTLGGGPWGGVAHRSREVFNAAGVFSPQGYVETCSTLAWMQLNRELLAISGDAVHAEEIERSAYNDLLGALAPNGEDWCYYVFPNGRRVHTTYWRCCKSSGAIALEELPSVAVQLTAPDEVTVQLYGPATARLSLVDAGELRLDQVTGYPFDGDVLLRVTPSRPSLFTLRLRVPSWATGAQAWLNGEPLGQAIEPGRYLACRRPWRAGDELRLVLPMSVQMHRRAQSNTQESRAPDGSRVRQEVMHHDHVAFSRGPLVYATGLIDGCKTEETLCLPDAPLVDWVHVLHDEAGSSEGEVGNRAGPALRVSPRGRGPLLFQPYYRAGGRVHGAWRLTWMSVAPAPTPPFTEESPGPA